MAGYTFIDPTPDAIAAPPSDRPWNMKIKARGGHLVRLVRLVRTILDKKSLPGFFLQPL